MAKVHGRDLLKAFKLRDLLKFINIVSITVYFIWYVTPVIRFSFFGFSMNQLIMLLIGMWITSAILLYPVWVFKWSLHLIIVIVQIMAFLIIALFGEKGNAMEFMMLGISFWFSLFVYHFYSASGWYNGLKKIVSIVSIFLFGTAVTTLMGLIVNPTAVRMLTFAGNAVEEDFKLYKLNIGGFDFIYSMVLLVPLLVSLLIYNKINNRVGKIILFVCVILDILVIVKASFAIGLMIMILGLVFGITSKLRPLSKFIIIGFIVCSLAIIPKNTLSLPFVFISDQIENPTIKDRLLETASTLSDKPLVNDTKDISGRMYYYKMSYETFLENPIWGVGPYYYIKGSGVGYHSQILDDLARYGGSSGIFLIIFLTVYYRYINKEWKKKAFQGNVGAVFVIFIIISFLNPSFSQPTIGFVMFFLLPSIPHLFREQSYVPFVNESRKFI